MTERNMSTHSSAPNQFTTLSPLLPHPSEINPHLDTPSPNVLYSGLFNNSSLGVNCEFANPLSSASSIYFIPTDHPIPEFLHQLTKMLSDEKNSKMISWINRKVVVHDPTGLTRNVFHKYFRHSNYASFQRQLNYFGFRKVSGKKGKMHPCSYVHDLVTNDIRSLLSIKRKNSSKASVQSTVKKKDKKSKDEVAHTNSSGRKKQNCDGTDTGDSNISSERPNKKRKHEDIKSSPSMHETMTSPSSLERNEVSIVNQVSSACDQLPLIDLSSSVIRDSQDRNKNQVIPQEINKENETLHSASQINKIIKKSCSDTQTILFSTVSYQDHVQGSTQTLSEDENFYFPRDEQTNLDKSATNVISCEDVMDPKSYESFRYSDNTQSNANTSWNVPNMDSTEAGQMSFHSGNFGFVDLEKDLRQLGTYFVQQNNNHTDTLIGDTPSFVNNDVVNSSLTDRRGNSCNPSSTERLLRPDPTLSMSAPAFSSGDGLSSTKSSDNEIKSSFLSLLKDDCDSVKSLKSLCGLSVTFGQVEPTPLNRMKFGSTF